MNLINLQVSIYRFLSNTDCLTIRLLSNHYIVWVSINEVDIIRWYICRLSSKLFSISILIKSSVFLSPRPAWCFSTHIHIPYILCECMSFDWYVRWQFQYGSTVVWRICSEEVYNILVLYNILHIMMCIVYYQFIIYLPRTCTG